MQARYNGQGFLPTLAAQSAFAALRVANPSSPKVVEKAPAGTEDNPILSYERQIIQQNVTSAMTF